jgi:hypothetical protein
MIIEISMPGDGKLKQIEIGRFPALDGWEIQAKFIDFAASHDKDYRRAYVLDVLSYCTVKPADIPLKTPQIVDNHLGGWENVQAVFEAALRHNGIDPEKHADKPHFWQAAGAEMATSFIAECTRVLGPALDFFSKAKE